MNDLSDWRGQIDSIDRQLVALLNRRAECVLRLAPLKRQNEIEVLDPEREQQVHHNLRAANNGPLPDDSLDAIFDQVMAAMRDLQQAQSAAE
jgi:chorismate mutase/prephenate dehydratase